MVVKTEIQPDHIENLFDDLDDLPPEEIGNYIRNLSPNECGWLARFLRRRAMTDRDIAPEEIAVETQVSILASVLLSGPID